MGTALIIFIIFYVISAAAGIVYMIDTARQTLKQRPIFAPSDIRYEEKMASGQSKKNIITTHGGARNCLRLVVTHDLLWVTLPLLLIGFSRFYDLEHVIPLSKITQVKNETFWGRSYLELTYTDAQGAPHVIGIRPRNKQAFLQALQTHSIRLTPDSSEFRPL